MEATYIFRALEIGDEVSFTTQDGGVECGKIKELYYIKEKGKERVVYTVNLSSGDETAVSLESPAGKAFNSPDEALVFLKAQKDIYDINDETV